jgi:hypothetical protein
MFILLDARDDRSDFCEVHPAFAGDCRRRFPLELLHGSFNCEIWERMRHRNRVALCGGRQTAVGLSAQVHCSCY